MIVFEVVEHRIRAAYSESFIGTLPDFDEYFAILEGSVAPGGRSASGKWELVDYRDRTAYSGEAHFKLSADGLSYLDRWSSEGGFSQSRGEKVRAGPCGVIVPFVQDAFDYVRNGKPIPEAYGN